MLKTATRHYKDKSKDSTYLMAVIAHQRTDVSVNIFSQRPKDTDNSFTVGC